MQDSTGIVYATSFPALDAAIEEVSKYFKSKSVEGGQIKDIVKVRLALSPSDIALTHSHTHPLTPTPTFTLTLHPQGAALPSGGGDWRGHGMEPNANEACCGCGGGAGGGSSGNGSDNGGSDSGFPSTDGSAIGSDGSDGTGSDDGSTHGAYLAVMQPGYYPTETSWNIDGGYMYPYSTSPVSLELTGGSHTLNMVDSFGDGWNEAAWTLTDSAGNHMAGPFTFSSGFSSSQSFDPSS